MKTFSRTKKRSCSLSFRKTNYTSLYMYTFLLGKGTVCCYYTLNLQGYCIDSAILGCGIVESKPMSASWLLLLAHRSSLKSNIIWTKFKK